MIRQGKYTKKLSAVDKVKRHTKRRWRWFSNLTRRQKIILIAAPILAFLILTPLITYLYYANDISDKERLMNRNNTGIVLMDRNDKVFYSTGRAEHRQIVPLDQIAESTKQALLASEDKNFYEHSGFSILSIAKALYANIMSQDITGYGGSTLTQQLAKNTLLSANQTFLRKYQELAVSIAIEQQYTKDEILEMYLNSVYFGENAFGIEDAAEAYFNKAPKDLTLAESSMLVGVLPAPSAYSPISGSMEYAKERQNTVLSRMVDNGVITKADKQAAIAEELAYAPQDDPADNLAPHFSQMVLKELDEKYGEERVARSGYQVRTTLDMEMQQKLADSVANNMMHIQLNGGSNASAVAIDPTTGEIRALVGSADWSNPDWGKVNMATTARQPGSSFKPIYYAEALAEGVITPATILEDVPTDFNGYKPLNADRSFRGDISVRNALSRSLNIPAVKVMQQLGIDNAIEAAQKMGISLEEDKDYGLSLALGSAEASLLEMSNAYAAFANQGTQYNTTTVKQINNKYDSVIFTSREVNQPVQSPQGSYLISDILSDTNARAPIFGSSLTVPGHTAAVKTGTTDSNRDAWTIGYTPQLAIGVWVGNNDNTVMQNGGSSMAGPIWVSAMAQILADQPNVAFSVPSGVIQRPVCFGTGALASSAGIGTYNEYFLASALPTKTCSPKEPPKEEEKEKKPEKDEEPTDEEVIEEPLPEETDPGNENGNGDGTGNGNGNGDSGGGDGEEQPIDPENPIETQGRRPTDQ
ncbi:MAG TPA: transglycosylase domain-containing protein [Candidatus Saccharimonadales bacterium]|nr:transglycosylase domain-containing protein [Candidatus Saccharimonadales bacterium]